MDRADFKDMCVKSVPLVKFYREGRERYPMNNRGRWHHGLLLPVRGCERYFFSDAVFDAAPGTLLYIPKGETYRIEFDGEESAVYCIDIELVEQIDARPMLLSLDAKSALPAVFSEACSVFEKNPPERDAALKSLVYRCFSEIIAQQHAHGTCADENKKRLAPALEYLHAHYTNPDFSVEELAKCAKMSRRYFEKLFFLEKGMTPRDYIIGLKMELARELLRGEKLSVNDVAYELGYADVYHFSKIFKQKNGVSPSEYRRRS